MEVLDLLDTSSTDKPSLYLDLEGANLSRYGSISILQIFDASTNNCYLFDVHTLSDKTFTTARADGTTLKMILESDFVPKAFFDVRNDSDALYAHFNISLACIRDLQLMELATRTSPSIFLNGLAKCIERDAGMTPSEVEHMKAVKGKGLQLFAPEHGGSYEVFNERPLAQELKEYCMQDVELMPRLYEYYKSKLTVPEWVVKVDAATKARLAESQGKDYVPNGHHKRYGPSW